MSPFLALLFVALEPVYDQSTFHLSVRIEGIVTAFFCLYTIEDVTLN